MGNKLQEDPSLEAKTGMNSANRKSMFAAMLVLALTASSCGWLDSLSARNELNLGVQAYTNKKYNEAIEHFQESIERDPDLIRSFLYLAIAYRAQYVPQVTSSQMPELNSSSISALP